MRQSFLEYLSELSPAEKAIAAKYKGVDVKDIPLEDLWMTMSKGNLKLSKKIKIFNLPAGRSCPAMDKCYKNCYAKKAERQYPAVRASRERNFRLAKENTQMLKGMILKDLKDGDVVRIHESGDMFNQAYIDMWADIAKERPNVMFYTYTKTEHLFDFSKLKSLPNFNVVSSLIAGKVNFGPEEEIQVRAKELGLPICPCKKGNKVICGEDCKICQTQSQVLFIQH
jgi:hypothetical protein